MWTLIFTICFKALQTEVPVGAGTSYPDVGPIFGQILQTYGNSIGNIVPAAYDSVTAVLTKDTSTAMAQVEARILIALIWFVWLMNQYVNLIIMLNFLVAVITEVYQDVAENQESIIYKHKAALNHELFMINKFFGWTAEFKVLVFSVDKDEHVNADKEWADFVDTIKQFSLEQSQYLGAAINELHTTVHNDNASK